LCDCFACGRDARGEANIELRPMGCFVVMIADGLRYGEAVDLTRDNLNLGKQIVSVRSRPATDFLPPFDVKDHEDRYVPIPKTTARMLAELLVTLRNNIPFILLTPNRNREIIAKWQEHRRLGKPWTNGRMANNMLVTLRRHAQWAGIADHKTILSDKHSRKQRASGLEPPTFSLEGRS